MKLLFNILSWIVSQLLIALICYATYNLALENTFGLKIGYLQWVAIIVISICIIPDRNQKKENNSKSSLDDILKHIKK